MTQVRQMNPIVSPELLAQEIIKEVKAALIEKPMTKKEAAEHLNITYATLERRIRNSVYPDYLVHKDPVSGHLYFFASELNQYLKSL